MYSLLYPKIRKKATVSPEDAEEADAWQQWKEKGVSKWLSFTQKMEAVDAHNTNPVRPPHLRTVCQLF